MSAAADTEVLLELVEVGWQVWEHDVGQEYVRGGTVIEIRDDPVAVERVFTIIDSQYGRTNFHDLGASQIDGQLVQRPSTAVIRSHVRRMQRELGASKGSIDPWQYRLMQTSMLLTEFLG